MDQVLIFTSQDSRLQITLWLGFAALAVINVFVYIFYQRRRWQNLPPGPSGWPIIGVIPMMMRAERQGIHTHTVMTALSQQYGSIFSFKLGTSLIVCLNTLESIKDAFNNADICDRSMALLDSMSEFPGKGIISSSGKVWWHHRRFIQSVFRQFDIGKAVFEDKIINEASHLIDCIAEQNGDSFYMTRLLGNASANTLCTVLFSKHYDYKDSEFKELLQHVRTIIQFIGSGGKMFFLPPFVVKHVLYRQQYQEYFKSYAYLRFLFRKIIEEHDRDFNKDVQDMIDAYLLEIYKSQKDKDAYFTYNNLEGNMLDLIAAAFDTTMNTLLWCFLYMITYPEIQSRIQTELDSVFGRNILPRKSDVGKLPFTEATLLEIQRIQTAIPMGGQHSTSKDTTIQGFDIPKGTIVLSNLWRVHHDPDIWGDPEEFRPERFLDRSGKVAVPPHFIPFSTGRRSCAGDKMAKSELFYFFTHLLHRFTFTKPADAPLTPFVGLPGLSYGPPDFQVCAFPRD